MTPTEQQVSGARMVVRGMTDKQIEETRPEDLAFSWGIGAGQALRILRDEMMHRNGGRPIMGEVA